jgi:hypothetical protein
VALIGAGVTLTWQSYGDEAKEIAKEMVRARVPSLAWLLPVSTPKSSPERKVTPVATIASPELAQQLKPMAINLALVRRSVEELAAQQTQMAQSLTTLQAIEQDIRQKMSSPTPSPTVAVPQRKNTTRVAAPQLTTQPFIEGAAAKMLPPRRHRGECLGKIASYLFRWPHFLQHSLSERIRILLLRNLGTFLYGVRSRAHTMERASGALASIPHLKTRLIGCTLLLM